MTVLFRGKPACECLAKWLPVYERELRETGNLVGDLQLFQLNGTAAASAGTHTGGAYDVTDPKDVDSNQGDVLIGRSMGSSEWLRTTAQGFSVGHRHGILRGCPHNIGGRYQIVKLDAGFNGLKGDGPDDGPRPIGMTRTWQEGIAWARARQRRRVLNARLAVLREQKAKVVRQLDRVRGKRDAL